MTQFSLIVVLSALSLTLGANCTQPMCNMFCANGYVLGADGCPTCACKQASVQQCPCGATCEMSGGGTGTCQTDGVTCAVNIMAPRCPTACSNVLCRMYCEYGNVVGENGCPLCECNPPPQTTVCPCGSACQLVGAQVGALEGVCSADEATCVDPRSLPAPVDCGTKCPDMMCMLFCPSGYMMDASGCRTCTCKAQSIPCVCGETCALSDTEQGVCQKDGTCGSAADLEASPCGAACDNMLCQMYCPYGNVLSSNGCPTCECNPAPATQNCTCGEPCNNGDAVGLCQTDGSCALTKPQCKSHDCPAMLCMMYCEHGAMLDEVTRCPTCRCNPPPPPPPPALTSCPCGHPCDSAVAGQPRGTCQADGTCGPLTPAPNCDSVSHCHALKCALYCPNGNVKDSKGCMTCRCNPAPRQECQCGQRCKQESGQMGVCQPDGVTCGPIVADKKVLCEKQCPPLMCNLFCPSGNALDQDGCAVCACLPEKVPCECGETCWKNGKAGICTADGSCGPLTAQKLACEKQVCPAVRCMSFCPDGNEVDFNGCPTCRCRAPPKKCPCGSKCALPDLGTGVCSADGVCSTSAVAPKCESCPAKMCLMFCPKGYVTDERGCSTCRCTNDCFCGDACTTQAGNAGLCKADGTCVAKSSGSFNQTECGGTPEECPAIKCLHYCPNGNKIDQNGCPSCDCREEPEPESCPCGTACATGVCQADGKTCATNIVAPVCQSAQCPKVMCMVFCPNGHSVDANGCPTCECNAPAQTCPCGQACTTTTGANGVCQADGVTCADTATIPQCGMKALATTVCQSVSCLNFCDSGTTVDSSGCPTCNCQPSCPCGTSCPLGTGLVGSCQDDGATCVDRTMQSQCLAAATSAPVVSLRGVVVGLVAAALALGVLVALWWCRRSQRKVTPEHNYADPTASGYVAPVVAVDQV